RDLIVGDIVDLEAAGAAIAQQHVGGVIAEEAAEADKLPIGADLTQLCGCKDRVVADVVNLIGAIGAAQNHVSGGAGRHWRNGRGGKVVQKNGNVVGRSIGGGQSQV